MWNKLNQPDNLQVLCHKCHIEAHKKFKEKQRPQQMELSLNNSKNFRKEENDD